MFRGVYTAVSGMIASQRKQEVLSHNLANAYTPGYKEDQSVYRAFPDILIQRIRDQQQLPINAQIPGISSSKLGELHTGVYTQEAIPSFRQGSIVETGRFLDLAIIDGSLPIDPDTGKQGTLLFAVADGEQIKYTRSGSFTVDVEGYLTTSNGNYLLNDNLEPILVGERELAILENGSIVFNPNQEAEIAGRLWLGYTNQPEKLMKDGQQLWSIAPDSIQGAEQTNGAPELVWEIAGVEGLLDSIQIKQGFIEQSNVDVTQTMTEMMSTFRLFEANQKVVQAYDQSMEKAVNQIGKLF